MLLMLLLLPTRMVAETTTEDPRYTLFNSLDGISDVTITDNGSYPWKMLDLKADGMENLGFTIPDGSKGLMSSNYLVDGSSSETIVNFTVEKPTLLTFKHLVSSEYFDKATITLDNKKSWTISKIKQIEIKVLLSVGKHSLKLSYTKDVSDNKNADRTCIYDLKTATTFSEYVADYVATNSTLTFKKITSDNLEGLDLSRMAVVDNTQTVSNMCSLLGIKASTIKNIVFEDNFKTYAPTSLREFFNGCETLETISGLEYLNTANVEFMDNMFNGCSALKSLDLTNFNTEKVTEMDNMFNGCSALKSLDLTKFNTANVEFMYHMFDGCSALTSLDLTNFNTANVEYMNNMFEGCSALKSLDLTKFNTAKVTNMSFMFNGCSALTSLDLTNFNTANVTDMSSMFSGCSALKSLDLTNFNTANVEIMYMMFNGCSALESLDLTNFNTAKVEYINDMFSGCSALTTIYVSDKFVTTKVINGSDMFTGCEKLKGYNDSKTDHTFANGYFTPVFDYAEFDNATGTLTFRRDLSKPEGAYDLNEENNEPGWRREKEPEDGSFVPGEKINISKVVFDASFANARPTSCYKWFDMCTSLTEIEGIENLNTEKVTNMGSMFSGCYVLNPLDVSNFNTQNVEDMSDMFVSCMNLKSLNVSNFDTQKVKDMNDMFYNCNSLTSLDVSNFNTQNVENMSCMFSCCEGLNSLDLSKFDTQKVTNMNSMFWNSSALTTIYASDQFVTTKVSSGAKMFQGCTNLKGFIDYISNKDKDNYKYANYTTGYFTKLVGKNGEEKIGATGKTLATENLVLDDGKDFVAYEPFAAKDASYSRDIPKGSTWGTLCLPFAIDQSKETECKFYRLTGIDKDCITLESCEEGKIPAGTPVLFKMNENEQTLSISTKDASIVKEPVAGTNTDVNLVGSFTKIGGNGNKGLAEYDYIIGKDRFWRVSDLNDGNGVGIKPMRAYIRPATASQARAAMLSIGKGDGTTAIDNLNAISNDANAEYYDANGRRTNGLQKGLNIVKRGSKTYKIMVK